MLTLFLRRHPFHDGCRAPFTSLGSQQYWSLIALEHTQQMFDASGAVTLGLLLLGHISFRQVLLIFVAQMSGTILGAGQTC